ncbi:MAG: HNH endonuclease [Mycoplasmataceae bacterium]|jgi:5-methylcytosine-specific restriction endonuclease McrA|nr:HNH endonuclease [Mycoplasmataceae bacterium]
MKYALEIEKKVEQTSVTSINDLRPYKTVISRKQVANLIGNYNLQSGMVISKDGSVCIYTQRTHRYADKTIGIDNPYDQVEYSLQKRSGVLPQNSKVNSALINTKNGNSTAHYFKQNIHDNGYTYYGKYKFSKFKEGSNDEIAILNSIENKSIEILENAQYLELNEHKNDNAYILKRAKEISEYNRNRQNFTYEKVVERARQFERNAIIKEAVLINANNICSKCGKLVGNDIHNEVPELQVHHIIPLSKDGKDILENCVALCPNCHRREHKNLQIL